jgi:hypothetical protein
MDPAIGVPQDGPIVDLVHRWIISSMVSIAGGNGSHLELSGALPLNLCGSPSEVALRHHLEGLRQRRHSRTLRRASLPGLQGHAAAASLPETHSSVETRDGRWPESRCDKGLNPYMLSRGSGAISSGVHGRRADTGSTPMSYVIGESRLDLTVSSQSPGVTHLSWLPVFCLVSGKELSWRVQQEVDQPPAPVRL